MNVLVALYADLELYPPSLNAVCELAKRVSHVHVVQRSLGHKCARLPPNVTVTSAVKREGELELNSIGMREKVHDFLHFVRCLRKIISQENPGLVIAYDPIPLMALRLSGKLRHSYKLWYHSHDKEAQNSNRPFSIGWWAYATEASVFRNIDFFSVPARERLPLFATARLSTSPMVLPNYPSVDRVRRKPPKRQADIIRLVYQGSLGRQHGFQEIIPWLGREVSGKHLHLTLVGKINVIFRDELIDLANAHGVSDRFAIVDFVPFTKLSKFLETFDIGLAIHKPVGVTYSTGGTASNKIYEYAAAGLPVVLYDSAHYRQHLDTRTWVAFSLLNWESFSSAIGSLITDLDKRSYAAIADITNELNYGMVFQDAWEKVGFILNRAQHRHLAEPQ